MTPRLLAILQALFVTFLWSTSWVLIKIGLADIPALTFAGLRYFLAFLILGVFHVLRKETTPLREISRRDWGMLILLGLLYYSAAQGTQFLGLAYLPAINFSLILNSIAIVVAVLGIFTLHEIPTRLQWTGALVFVAGALIFFYPLAIPKGQAIGYFIAGLHVLSSALASILGRGINRSRRLNPLTITLISMGAGSLVLLFSGLMVEPFPELDFRSWGIIAWLALINTAFAFSLWNHTLRTLTAMESSIINNTMLVQVAILAWIFLGERITSVQFIGMLLAAVGILLVQMRKR